MRTAHLTALLAVSIFALTGCSASTTAEPAPSVSSAGSTSEANTPSPTATTATPTKSDRGNLIKKAGDAFGFTYDGQQVANFVVTGVTVDPKCNGEFVDPAEFGHFVKLDVQGETTASLPDDIFMASGAWSAVAENGTTFNGDPWSMAAAGCMKETDRLPNIIGAGERVAGAVILDVPTPHGIIVLDLGNGASWEWAY